MLKNIFQNVYEASTNFKYISPLYVQRLPIEKMFEQVILSYNA